MFHGLFNQKVLEKCNVEASTADPLDELSFDESKLYKVKISKWIKHSLVCVSDTDFWFLLWTANYTRRPLLHFYRFLCAKPNAQRLFVVELVSERVGIAISEFERLLATADHWIGAASNFAGMERRSADDTDGVIQTSKAVLRELGISLLLQNAASFDRRVARAFRRRPASCQTWRSVG